MKPASTLSLTVICASLILAGCASSGSSASGVANPFSTDNSSSLASIKVNTMRVFGDSYSDPNFTSSIGTINWGQQLQARGTVTRSSIYAIGGARAQSGELRAFDQQINKALNSGNPIVDRDLTVVYLGHNDIGRTGSPDGLVRSTTGYKTGVDRLVQAGAANENRRLFVTQLHAWGRGPGVSDGVDHQVRAWNTMLAGIANSHPNIIAVDMYTAFERVFQDPQKYGFTNVTTADSSRSSIDALYHDATHFGNRGQEIITRVYQHYLSRGWDWANSVSAGAGAAEQLNKDIDQGTLVLSMAGQKRLKPGFRLVALGMDQSKPFSFKPLNGKVFQPFASTRQQELQQSPRGLALDMNLGSEDNPSNSRLGVAVFQHEQPQVLETAAQRNSRRFTSDAVSLYWHKPVSGFLLSSQLSHMALNFNSYAQDSMVNLTLENASKGDTWSLENKLRYPLRSGAMNVTPWVSLTSQSHSMDPALTRTLYTTDVLFSSSRMNELLSGLGLDIQADPIHLAGNKQLRLGGSLYHVQSLHRDSVMVSMQEAGSPGVVQRELFPSAKISRTQLGLQAALDVAKNVRFSATYGTQLQDVKNTSSLLLLANIQY